MNVHSRISKRSPTGLPVLEHRKQKTPDTATVSIRPIFLRTPISISITEGVFIHAHPFPQPDLQLRIAIEGDEKHIATAQINGSKWRRVLRAVQDDRDAGRELGQLELVGSLLSSGVVKDAGIEYIPADQINPLTGKPIRGGRKLMPAA